MISNMKSLIAVKFCILLLIGTSLGQNSPGPIHVATVTIPVSNPSDQTGTLAQQGLKVVHQVLDPAGHLVKEVAEWMVNATNKVEHQIVEAGKEAYQTGTTMGGKAIKYVNEVAEAATEKLGLSGPGNLTTEKTKKN
uniref:Putative secreted protein n=1 Tax=Panstrongylus lignarius TaxID=156445 RepID=A0A224XZQ5_9HEMI